MPQTIALTNNFNLPIYIFCEPEGFFFELLPAEKASIILHEPFLANELDLVYSLYKEKFALNIWTKKAIYNLLINDVEVF